MGNRNPVAIKFDFVPTFPLILFTSSDCILYKSIRDMEWAWMDSFGLNFGDVTNIYDREAVPYKATESTISKKGLIFTSKVSCYTFLRSTQANQDHKQLFRKLIVDFLSTRKEHATDTGVLGMEGLQPTDPMEKLLDRVEAYAVAMV